MAARGGSSTTVPVLLQRSWHINLLVMSINAIVVNDSIKLPVHVPDGTRVEIVVPHSVEPVEVVRPSGSFVDDVRDLIGSVEGPADWAAEHDHYIHGTPKRADS